eukprot:Phypoly_transcript_11634.p1 GENE.Phypoly_transcript_11634~~Phypoly_transcript_11634.p1  ORF type:complete len:147 (-),score=16.39 Phypoly_transcript_11634:574-1014(-)
MTDDQYLHKTPTVIPPYYSPVVVVTVPTVKVDGKVDSTTSETVSSPAIVVGSSWFGGTPVVLQQVDTAAAIEASRASVEKAKWQSIFFGGGLLLFGIAAIIRGMFIVFFFNTNNFTTARKPFHGNEINLSKHLGDLVGKVKKQSEI